MIELANLKFGYKVLHKLLPRITNKLCMFDSKNKLLIKQHNYDTRYKRTPYLPKNASQQYKSSFLCRGLQSLLTLNVETTIKPSLFSFTKHCKGLLLNKMQTTVLIVFAVNVETCFHIVKVETSLICHLLISS